LEVVAFTHFKAGDFSNGVGFVGVLEWGGEEGRFLDWLGGVTGVDAGAAEEEELFDAMGVGGMDDMGLDEEVEVDEGGAVAVIGGDTADMGGSEEDVFGVVEVEEVVDGTGVSEVKILVRAVDEGGVSFAGEVVEDGGADEATVSGDVDEAIFVHEAYFYLKNVEK
jgi:hypothetical protein